jgi:hypothetical protein
MPSYCASDIYSFVFKPFIGLKCQNCTHDVKPLQKWKITVKCLLWPRITIDKRVSSLRMGVLIPCLRLKDYHLEYRHDICIWWSHVGYRYHLYGSGTTPFLVVGMACQRERTLPEIRISISIYWPLVLQGLNKTCFPKTSPNICRWT